MENHIMIPGLKINTAAEIGTVVLIVEGHRDEFLIIQYIFCQLFMYKMTTRSPKNGEIRYAELTLGKNRVVILNAESSNMKSLFSVEEYIDRTYAELVFTHHIDIRNSPVFYIWDRDRQNNSANVVNELLRRLTSPYENKDTHEHGMLLISYPAIESMIVSSFDDISYLPDDYSCIKEYVRDQKYNLKDIDEKKILMATKRMIDGVKEILGKTKFEIDLDSGEMLKIFQEEEKYYSHSSRYRLLSLAMYVLVWLGIIQVEE